MRRKKLTDRQSEVLAMIRKFHKETGCMPTFQEIADLAGITPPTVFSIICKLEESGYIKRDRRPRKMKLL